MTNTVKATFDTTTQTGKMMVFNAQNGASISMKDLEENAVIEATGVLQYTDTFDTYGAEQEGTITVIFAKDGQSYASVSAPVAKAAEKLIDMVNEIELEEFKVRIVQGKSKGGRDFLNLQLVF